MRTQILFVLTLATVSIFGAALAQTPKENEDHSAHSPAGNAAAASTPAAAVPLSEEAFNQQMKAMLDMRQKMQSVKTSAERSKVMDDHMRIMQSGMAMMAQMRGGTSGMGNMSGMRGTTSGGMGTTPPGAPGSGGQSQAEKNSSDSNMSGSGMMNMHLQMERRMVMMEQMLQMMVDRLATVPSK